MRAAFKGFLTMAAVAVGSAVLFWLLRDHWGHSLGALPYLLFLACPLMHLFMHHGHRNGHHDHDLPPREDEPTARPGS